MALALRSAVTINPAGTEVYIEFRQATGDYNDPDNLGGFGAPNDERNTLAIVIFAQHMKVAGNEDAEVLVHDPLTVQSFTITMSRAANGVLNFNLFALPIFQALGSYEDGDVVYDNENPSAPFIKEMVDSEWVERTAEELIGNDTVTQLNDYTFAVPDAIDFANKLRALKMKKLRTFVRKECEAEDFEQLRRQFEYVEGLLNSATNSFCAQAYNEAQIDIEEIFEFGVEIDLLENVSQ